MGFSALIAPRVEMYTVFACQVHAPEYEPNGIHLVQPHSTLSMNTTGIQDAFPLVPFAAHESVQPVSVYIPASQGPSKQQVPDRDRCTSDPVVQAAVAELSAGLFIVFLLERSSYYWCSSGHLNGRFGLSYNRLVGFGETVPSSYRCRL